MGLTSVLSLLRNTLASSMTAPPIVSGTAKYRWAKSKTTGSISTTVKLTPSECRPRAARPAPSPL